MSRITKEEIEKTKCGRFLLSDENIGVQGVQTR